MVEENLLGVYRTHRLVYVMKPSSDGNLSQWRMRGHVIAFANPDLEDLLTCFPLSFEDIPKHIQVIPSYFQNRFYT